jgi:FkbM family methyltransferase
MPSSITINGTTFQIVDELPHRFWSGVNEGRWEPESFRIIDHFLTSDWRFVDIGAWIGPMTLYAAKKCGRIDAFECDPIAIRQLRDNLAINPDVASKVQLHEYALSDADGFVQLYSRAIGNSETSIFSAHERDNSVMACNESFIAGSRDIRNVFRDHGYLSCARTFVKMDIEGAEFRVVPHLSDLISECSCVWYISFHELNINPPNVAARHARISEMLRALIACAKLHWYGSDLRELDKEKVIDSVLAGTWPVHASLVFSRLHIE